MSSPERLKIETEKKEKEMTEEEAIRGIFGYLDGHLERVIVDNFRATREGGDGQKLEELKEKEKFIASLRSKFLEGETDKELKKMIKETPSTREDRMRALKEATEKRYIFGKGVDEYQKDIEEEASRRRKLAEILESGKLSSEKIKKVLGREGKKEEEK